MSKYETADIRAGLRFVASVKKGDLTASGLAAFAVLVAAVVGGAWPLAGALLAVIAGNVLRVFARAIRQARDGRDFLVYLDNLQAAYLADVPDADVIPIGDKADV